MQSTGHSSMHPLSSTSTQGRAMMYVTSYHSSSVPTDRRVSAELYALRGCGGDRAGPSSGAVGRRPPVARVSHVSDPVLGSVRDQPGRYRPPVAGAPDPDGETEGGRPPYNPPPRSTLRGRPGGMRAERLRQPQLGGVEAGPPADLLRVPARHGVRHLPGERAGHVP